ncbi:ABC transporter permease [Pelagibius litoralis]|uniref:Transport permease protein n=1 Tax=Pelagibius litoralis TaxID=374515 RepID=A0A967F252_9PROT|nr:ABC transporter permease [Pelagibius litoralis]NIA71530.1 ABC transporter permease [Pelagibius litoralis]
MSGPHTVAPQTVASKALLSFRAWRPPSYRRFNGRGFWTHYYHRGVLRFFRFGLELLVGPLVSSLLFVMVFAVAQNERAAMVPGIDLIQFIVPGIILYGIAHTAFENAAAMLVFEKMEGMITDVQMAPLSPLELLAGYALSSATCGLSVGLLVGGAAAIFVDFSSFDASLVLGFAVATALFFGLLGTVVGLWAERWDHYSAVEGFVVVPLGLLSGTFFSIERLPEAFREWIFYNPVFYAIDGFRAGLIGHAESSHSVGFAVLGGLILGLALLGWRLFAVGYKIKP